MPLSLRRGLAFATALLGLTFTVPAFAGHTFDLATTMPDRLSIMFAMSWFGIESTDPQGGGADPGYGNWLQDFPACSLSNDPATCQDFPGAGLQRSIASKRRPLAGIYSSSGRDAESLRRVDLMLSTLRRPCDRAGGFDAWAIQIDSVRFTSKYPKNQQSATWDLAYRALGAFYDRADAAGLTNAVVAADDATVYWHFGLKYGVSTQADRLAALQADLADLATMAASHASGVKINGKPLLAMYVDAALVSPAEFQGVLDGARAASGVDFYALGTTLDSTFYSAFDALTPWVNLGVWGNAQGANLHDQAVDYTKQLHAKLVGAIDTYPGRVMFGALSPGFDDYTENWGACQAREIPRDPAVLAGQTDYLASLKQSGFPLKGTYLETWDDWTEGSEFEPDVTEGTDKIVALRQGLGNVFGDPADAPGEAALTARWTGFGQARSCCFAGGACADAGSDPVVVVCPLSSGDGGVPSSDGGPPGMAGDGGVPYVPPSSGPDAALPGNPETPGAGAGVSSGCNCRTAPPVMGSPGLGIMIGLASLSWVRRRRAPSPATRR